MKQVQQCVCSGALQAAWLNAYLLVTFKYTMPTSKPHQAADALRLPGKGRLEVGADADITLFEVSCGPTLFTDTEAGARNGDRQLLPLAALVGGELVLTHYGKSHHAFCV